MTSSTRSTINQPETVAQARRFDTVRKHYEPLGLCPACASQAAYGHQHGFSVIDRPCGSCQQVVARLPRQETNGWRSLEWQACRQTDEDRSLMHTLALGSTDTPLSATCASAA